MATQVPATTRSYYFPTPRLLHQPRLADYAHSRSQVHGCPRQSTSGVSAVSRLDDSLRPLPHRQLTREPRSGLRYGWKGGRDRYRRDALGKRATESVPTLRWSTWMETSTRIRCGWRLVADGTACITEYKAFPDQVRTWIVVLFLVLIGAFSVWSEFQNICPSKRRRRFLVLL